MSAESDLRQRRCTPCEGGVEPLRGEDSEGYLRELEGWELKEGRKISRTFDFSDFREALAFVNEVGRIAEDEGHHPDIHLSWGRVVVELWTHAIDGLSVNDFILAAKTDAISRSRG